ncbi:RagB/SusD family nutrient uptake outer membrane protein [Proteiniphilum sp. X52]|uniref:RagB/SusD family nutrient uptake outer membrane protein n=1 Tax=Proteiniphilum sp. X52 TaxID=2382159 RepID=UPI000F0A8A56|nr:RagB/SusD family nutrient uptake outer membrane protein [Proteiniphilum sp. X52]RNC64006.1 RagB/SusD family nutrient uptake outer membrane protein [Proteiniphilum sp. X52]
MRPYKKQLLQILSIVLLSSVIGCSNFLEEKVYTEYDPNEFLKEQSGIDALLTGAYARSRIISYTSRNYTYLMNEFTTDIAFETGGGLERDAKPYIDFTWAINDGFLNNFWIQMYQAIASANNVLSVADGLSGLPETLVNKIKGEARFIRGTSYYFLYNIFGPTPIIEIPSGATPDEIEQIGKSTPRAIKDVFVKYLIDDLTFAAENLTVEENPIGRATKGAALGVLTKLYLHEKDWENVITTAQEVIDLNYYSLYSDYTRLFSVEGEDNKEFIYRAPCIAQNGYHNNYMPHAFPPNYPIQSNWVNFGAQFRTYTTFYKTFDENDNRRKLIIAEYEDLSGTLVKLLEDENGNPLDDVRSFKYWPDPNAVGEANGNDIVYVRYADILMSKAEALNEKNYPNQESIDLINKIRHRAGVSEVSLDQFSSKEELRDFILAERGREFFSEGLRREDLIRHGKFISSAIDRGKAAKPYQIVFPIPQRQIEANEKLVQNEGYTQ